MGDHTKIEWTDHTWNPVTGCTRVSPGCEHCYIDWSPPFRIEGRHFRDRDGLRSNAIGSTTGVRLHHDRLDWPLRKRSWRGKRVFVCSLADLFHDEVPDHYIAAVFAVMALTPEVTYQVLTKRPARMRALLASADFRCQVWHQMLTLTHDRSMPMPAEHATALTWPLPNVWLGVTVEDQARAVQRVPLLLDTPAAVRWLSCEPLLGPVDLAKALRGWSPPDEHPAWKSGSWMDGRPAVLTASDLLQWVVVGGESGPAARPMHPDWARSLRDQCQAAVVPFLFKQWGEWVPDERIDKDGIRHVGCKPDAKDPRSLVMHPAGMTALTPDNPFDPWDRGHPGWRTIMRRLGKRVAGRELDGRTHDEYPGGS